MASLFFAPFAAAQTPPCPIPNDPAALVDAVWPFVDVNGNGGISLQEVSVLYPLDQSMFDVVDANYDGAISRAELLAIVPILTMLLGQDVLSLIDLNHDRLIQYGEVSGYVTQAQFNLVDKNGNGVIDCDDLDAVVPPVEGELVEEGEVVAPEGEIVGTQPCPLPNNLRALLTFVMPVVDLDGDGGLSKAEVRTLYPAIDEDLVGTGVTLDDVFSIVDSNHNGSITVAELMPFVPMLGLDAYSLLEHVDFNGDHIIQFAEVSAYGTRAQFDQLDHNGNGVLDCGDLPGQPPVEGELPGEGEPGGMVYCPLPMAAEPILGAIWPLTDANADGLATVAELTVLTPPLADAIVRAGDRNGDLALSYLESMALVNMLLQEADWSYVDANHDGGLQLAEVQVWIGMPQQTFARLDLNGNGVLDCGDIGPGMSNLGLCDLVGIVIASFGLLDLNGDGAITLDEVEMAVIMKTGVAVYPPIPNIRLLFDQFDTNDDGRVTLAELEQWRASCDGTVEPPAVGPCEAAGIALQMFDELDANHDGAIVLEEVNIPVIAIYPPPPVVYVFEFFAQLDLDSDQRVTRDELAVWLERCNSGPVPCPLPNDQQTIIDLFWPLLDTDGNGGISLEEIQLLVPGVDQATFAMIDLNHDGQITRDEIPVILTLLLGVATFAPWNYLFMDADGNGLLDLEEVRVYLLIDEAQFALIDANGNGWLDCEDIRLPEPPPPTADPCAYVAMVVNLFAVLDANHDGALTLDEIRMPVIMGAAGLVVDPTAPVPDLVPLFRAFDRDHDGRVTKAEVEAVQADCEDGTGPIIPVDPVPMFRRLLEMFAIVDTNHDGAVSMMELAMYFQAPPEIFLAIDANGDGLITVAELEAMLPPTTGGGFEQEPLLQLRRHVEGNGLYAPGEVLTIAVTLYRTRPGAISALGLSETLPEGWSVAEVAGSAGAEAVPAAGDTGTLEFAWLVIPSFPARIVYRVNVPETATGMQVISGEALFRTASSTELTSGVVETAVAQGLGAEWAHSADSNRDWAVSLTEILRVIQFFNMDGYHCAESTEDGYGPGPAEEKACRPHDTDYMLQDWRIDLSELLRLIQLFNSPGRAYYAAEGTEDGFAPVLYQRD
jgi:Ca2+-binding EF-hand superfamily protein